MGSGIRIEKNRIQNARMVSIKKILGIPDNGRRIAIRCPVHGERTPSFVIYPDGTYHCFGCGLHGSNAIDFLMNLGASFNEAIQEIEKYG